VNRWARVSALGFVLGLVVMLAACGSGSTMRQPYSFGDPPPPSDLPTSITTGDVVLPPPTPSPREARAARLATRDRTLSRLLVGVSYRLVGGTDWASLDNKPIGLELRYALARPINVDADLPSADIPPDTLTQGHCVYPYAATWIHLSARAVRSVTVLVDLRRGRVADIWTDAARGEVSPVAGRPYPDCEQKG
jgi:hypothetical protein